MKSKTKRLSALFLSLAMCVSFLQATAFAAYEVNPTVPGHTGHKLAVVDDSVKFDANGTVTYKLQCLNDNKIFNEKDTAEATTKRAATCTAPASVTYAITILGKEYKESFTETHPLGHDYQYTVNWPSKDYVTNGTLGLTGVTVTGVCARCGAKHTFSEGYHGSYKLIVKENPDKRTYNASIPCQAGSATFTASFAITDIDPDAFIYKTVALNESKAYPYFPNGPVAHKSGSPKIENKVEPTCTADGHYDIVTRCTVCNEVLSSIPHATGKTGDHTAAAAKKENVVKATYAKAGSYDLVVRCADCGKVLSSTHKTVAKLKVNAPTLSSVKNVKGKKATVAWKKASSVNGYQVQYATSSSFKSAKTVKTTAASKTLSKLTKNKKYYVRVRSYKVSGGKTYYSSWSKVKTVTIKK